MKSGFSLLELIISTLIASMIGGILLTALYQGNRFQITVDTIVDSSMRIGIVANQLEKDLMGAFIPMQSHKKEEKTKKAASPEEKKADGKKTGTKEEREKLKPLSEKKEEKKLLEKIFVSTNKAGNLDTLTFITNDPLAVFVGKDVGVVKPKMVRVQYTLKPEPERKDSFALMRQESVQLDMAQYKNVREYEIIGGIKQCSITFTARIEKKEEQSKEQAGKAVAKAPHISYEYKTFPEWASEHKQEDNKKEELPRIPYYIEIKMILWDSQYKKQEGHTLFFAIPTDTVPIDITPEKKEPPKKEESNDADKDGGQEQSTKVAQNPIETLTITMGNITKMLSNL
jgi:hypothetical protein